MRNLNLHIRTYRYHYALVTILTLIWALGMNLYQYIETPYAEAATIGKNVTSFDELKERFELLAEDKGALYAFEVLRRAEVPPNTDMHLMGHVVGDVLYKQKGLEAIADCTQDFRNACSHTIVIGALNEFGGEPALDMIRESCKKAPGGTGAYTMCYHGLGHGVFAFYGYSLPETIEMCEKTGTDEYRNREAIECVGGAVMELSGGGGHDPQLWKEAREKYLDDPVGLCMGPDMPAHTKAQCLTYMTPELWTVVGIDLGRPQPELFDDAFALCDAIPRTNQVLRDSCYGGFGKEFVPLALGRDIREIHRFASTESAMVEDWCSRAAPLDGQKACIEQALQSVFWGGENDPAIAFRFCGAVRSSDLQDACYGELDSAINSYLRGEQRSRVCMQLPEKYRIACTEGTPR